MSTYWKSFRRKDIWCVRLMSTLFSLNGASQPHQRPPPPTMVQELYLSSALGTFSLPSYGALSCSAVPGYRNLGTGAWPWFFLVNPMFMILIVTYGLTSVSSGWSHHCVIAPWLGLWVESPSQVLSCLSQLATVRWVSDFCPSWPWYPPWLPSPSGEAGPCCSLRG